MTSITAEEDAALREAMADAKDPFGGDLLLTNHADEPVKVTGAQMGFAPTLRAQKPDVAAEDFRDCFVVVHAALEPLSDTQRQRVLRGMWELFGLKGQKL